MTRLGGIVGARRVGLVVLTSAVRAAVAFLVAVSALYFLVEAGWPGDQAALLCGIDCTPDQVDEKRVESGIDDGSVLARYGRWLREVATMDLGLSLYNEDIAQTVSERWEPTIEVALAAELAAAGIVLAGASLTRGRKMRWRRVGAAATAAATLAWSVPSVAAAVLLLRELSYRRQVLPLTGWVFVGDGLGLHLRHAAIPFLGLVVPSVGFWVWLLLRDRSRGARADLALVARVFPFVLPWAFSAAMLTERLVAVPGLGTLLLSAVQNGDDTSVRATLAVFAAVGCAVGFLGSVLAGLLEGPAPSTTSVEVADPAGMAVAIDQRRRVGDPRRWAWTPSRVLAVTVLALVLVGAVAAGWQPSPWPSRWLADPDAALVDGQVVEEFRMVVHGARRVVNSVLPVAAVVTVLTMILARVGRQRGRGLDLVSSVVMGLGAMPAFGLGVLATEIIGGQLSWPDPWPEVAWVAATIVVPGYLWSAARVRQHRLDIRGLVTVFLRLSALAVFSLGAWQFLFGGWVGWGGGLAVAITLTWEDDSFLWATILAATLTCFSLRVLADWLDPGSPAGTVVGAQSPEAEPNAEEPITVTGEAAPVGAR